MESNETQRSAWTTTGCSMINFRRLPKFAMARRRRLDRLRMLLLVSLSIVMLLAGLSKAQETLESSVIEMDGTQTEAVARADTDGDASTSRDSDGDGARVNHGEGATFLSTRLPRQYFRLKVGPTSRASSVFKLVSIRRRAALQQAGKSKADEIGVGDQWAHVAKREHWVKNGEKLVDELNLITATNQTKPDQKSEKQLTKATTRKISSAALKKLLSQTLPKFNGTIDKFDASTEQQQHQFGEAKSNKGPNFRFVFIQRANAKVPTSNSSSSTGSATTATATATTATTATTTSTSTSTTPASLTATSKRPPKQTLMASVSRQLGTSLFYSAANFMSHNFTSGCSPATLSSNLVPSLSSLAALVGNGCRSDQSSNSTGSETLEASNQLESNQIEPNVVPGGNSDLKRLSRPQLAEGATKSPIQQAATKTKPSKKSRPSKIYNLPVKFIANGQPSAVTTLHSIRQHFATIKKMQQQQVEAGWSDSSKARKKPAGSQPHLKGTNSRLIYLPLKYLSNAKPHMLTSIVMGTSKTSHKKSKPGTKTGSKSTKSHES